jgi:hypothetical protein
MPAENGHDMNRAPRPRRPRSLLLAIAVVMLLSVGAASAGAASSIEGVWSFENGQIGIQRLSNGTYEGTVVVATKFAECTHEVGEPIWTGMTEQPDGSYWGLHQWFLGGTECKKNPDLGPTAWRVLEEANGSHYLRVCFSHPGTSQPTIAADGAPEGPAEYAAYHVTYGCYSSTLTAPLPVAPGETPPGETPPGTPGSGTGAAGSGSGTGGSGTGTGGSKESLTLPSAKKCLSARLFKIHLLDPKYDPFKTVSVTIKGRKIATTRKGNHIVATIDLKGLPTGAFTVEIRATTVLRHHLSANRTFHTCVKKITKSGK